MNEFQLRFNKILFYFNKILEFKEKKGENEDFDYKIEDKKIKLNLFLKHKKYLKKIVIEYEILEPENAKIFRNGFSSWSSSYLIEQNKKFRNPPIKELKYHYLNPIDPDERCSYFLTYLKNNKYLIFYPENSSIFTYFYLKDNLFRINLEIDKEVYGEVNLPEILIKESDYPILNGDFNEKIYGWTSWYYYYRNIDKEKIIKNIDYIDKLPINIDYFQIDDGWEDYIGDWNEKPNFKNSLKEISEKINEKNVKPGIWVAPFAVEKSSKIFKEKSPLILKNKNGKPVPVGFNPLWGGYFYALDMNRDDSIDYVLEKLILLKEKGFELFKLDFLYTFFNSYITKKNDESIYERYIFVMKKIKKELKASKILGCGAPYILMDGIYDILRIGPDTKDGWKDYFTRLIGFSENVEAFNSLRNTLFRTISTPKFFLSDPDVVFIKPKKLNSFERNSILIIDYFLSNVIFFSDPLYNLNDNDFSLLLKLKEIKNYYITDFKFNDYLFEYKISFENNIINLYVNLSDKRQEIEIKGDEIFNKRDDNFIYPHESRVFIQK